MHLIMWKYGTWLQKKKKKRLHSIVARTLNLAEQLCDGIEINFYA